MGMRNEHVVEAEYRQALMGMNSLYERLLVTQQTTVSGSTVEQLKERIKLREADVLSLARELRALSQRHPFDRSRSVHHQ